MLKNMKMKIGGVSFKKGTKRSEQSADFLDLAAGTRAASDKSKTIQFKKG
jgi:hypothetical protein